MTMADEPSGNGATRAGAGGEADWFSADRFAAHRARLGVTWGRPCRILHETESTNDLALSAANTDAKTGIVWVTRAQTHGRGRRGNRWLAEPGSALLCSTLLRWPGPPANLAGFALAAGLSVREVASRHIASSVRVKWPNDVLVQGRKLAGILVEARKVNESHAVVIGVGLNVLAESFPDGAPRATSLALERGHDLELELLMAELLGALELRTRSLLMHGITALVEEANRFDALLGCALRVENEGASVEGMGRGFSTDGHLLLEVDGQVMTITAGHVATLDDVAFDSAAIDAPSE